ncbi:hypothetical protein [Knoellia sp. LjRoot47]|uniref:hypothetical protein n=1 Tax=Knoellia sp. LjRoot47 TaxID=3342330 RepID=UPI003ECD3B8A
MSDPILELLAAPPSPALSVDENAVHTGGRRRLRRRNLRRAGLGAGAAVAAAAIAFTTLGSGLGGEALPAGPSTSVDAGRRVSAALFDGDWSVEVRPGAPADQPNVMFYKGSGTSRQQLAGSSADATVVSMGTGSGAEGVMLGTAPASAAKFLVLTNDALGGIEQDNQLLPGTDYQAIALRFDEPTDTDRYAGVTWMNDKGDGVVRSATGQRLQSAKLAGTDTFWVDRDARHMGVFTPDGGSTKPVGDDATTTMGYGQKAEKGGGWTWRSVTLLPAGARDVTFLWADEDYHSAVFTELLAGSGEVVAFADATAPGASQGPRVTSVTWTDKAGTRHTDAVK